jgi:hypothetical protein
MLDAARKSEWDELTLVEKRRAEIVAGMMVRQEEVGALDAQTAEIVRQILDCDLEIKALTEAWLVELQGILASTSAEKKLLHTYNPST